ncbi:Plant ascorbate peroxidase [Phaffia rhodozyma]|uniref:Peroxidase n=1 Tax=Phaffia rhodozyma TaxID=264483 RepID=A0A0F7SIM1_PHARH|nr:Plant ascorbate peroxidase [Phaffia rhodozyma]
MHFFSSVFLGVAIFYSAVNAAPNLNALRLLQTDSRFVGIISPCTAGGSSRTTAAEWLRSSFHDAGSYDAASGTGGIDGSLAYETDRAENGGTFDAATITQYRSFQQPGVTIADLIVLGAVTAVGACGGPTIPFRAGRIDASAAGIEGALPLPEETLETHQQKFARMGFSNRDMISLVACGHTIGGVHKVNSPTITSAANAAFDSTRTTFDNYVAREYINGSLINPLAQPVDMNLLATSSDTRIFQSDGNATIKSYSDSSNFFMQDCATSFSKMFDEAIPNSVTLTDALTPYPVAIGGLVAYRNDAFSVTIGSVRIYNMVGKWKSVAIKYNYRDGTQGTAAITAGKVRTISNGLPIEISDFTAQFEAIKGVSSLSAVLTLNDGTIYSSAEEAEKMVIEDRININYGAAYSCRYTSPSGVAGLNVTMQVLGPYNAADKVELLYDLDSDATRTTYGEPILATYRGSRAGTAYNFYNVYILLLNTCASGCCLLMSYLLLSFSFIEDVAKRNIGSVAARVTRADGSVQTDTRQGVWWKKANFVVCPADATVPTTTTPSSSSASSILMPTAGLGRRVAHVARKCIQKGYTNCFGLCVDTMADIESCGGCVGKGGVDCTTLEGIVACEQGVCVVKDQFAL